MKHRINRRKLLVASVGVATVSYIAACSPQEVSGNLMAYPGDAAVDAVRDSQVGPDAQVSGNLMPPPPQDAAPDVTEFDGQVSGNLMPPPPADAGDAATTDGSTRDGG